MTILTEIVNRKRAELADLKQQVPTGILAREAEKTSPPQSLKRALTGGGVKLIAEVKQASPSRGVLVDNFNAVALAKIYANGRASAISVLTEKNFFFGNILYLNQIKFELGLKCPPLLRKDFIFDEYQIYETRAKGGDSLLLIVQILTSKELEGLLKLSSQLGLDCLVEVHNETEIDIALKAGANIIGINNRDLNTFQVDIETTSRLRPLIPESCIVVSESGFRTRCDIDKIKELNINAVLVGEALMTSANTANCMEELIG